ncbi:MAG: phenylalanine--tRNA ligase subunit beta [Pseudobdellovibrionaceae bacterium]
MKISLKWLNEFVDVQDYLKKPEALAELLTRAGLEVEEISNKGKDLSHVVSALILEKGKHPNADKLSLCQVTTGEGVVHQIVCGAQNHKQGDRVVLALPGAVLPGNFKIAQAQVRGVDSGGMLCSLKELGLAKESEGIVILSEDAPLGKPIAEVLGLDDVTFELKVTPNRADCLSHYGLAREVSCLLGRELKSFQAKPELSSGLTSDEIQVDLRAIDLCPRYTGRYISKIKVGPSPVWLKSRLESVGLNSINNIVDITNYVMMELGQPLHAFDAHQIRGKKLIIDRPKAGEKFITLDGTELNLKGDELMIQDTERSLCIGGVIGGKNSGVTEETQSIFLEAAYFSPSSARKSSRSHGLNTDSGYRFSRGVDPNNTLIALDRATELILKVAGGEARSGALNIYPAPVTKKPIQLALQTISDRLGYTAEEKIFLDFMTRLGCQTQPLQTGSFDILPPTFRFDLEIEMDLVEEYARLNGYEHIPESIPPLATAPSLHDPTYTASRKVAQTLRGLGYQEALNFAFTGQVSEKKFIQSFEKLKVMGLSVNERPVRMMNPLNEMLDVMRSTLSQSLTSNLLSNYAHGNLRGRIFEIGKTFEWLGEESYKEHWRWGLLAWGESEDLWSKKDSKSVLFELKDAVESVLRLMGFRSYQWQTPESKSDVPDFIHPGQAVVLVLEGKKLGFLGALHPQFLEENKIRENTVALAELIFEPLLAGLQRTQKFDSVPRFPAIDRDLALVMAKDIKAGMIQTEIKKQGGALLQDVKVFDVYEGEKLPAGQKSVAYRLKYQDKNATLQDAMVQESVNKILSHLQQKFSITVR